MNIALDIETESLAINTKINFIGAYGEDDELEYYLFFEMPKDLDKFKDFVKRAHEGGHKFVGANLKFDAVRLLYNYGIEIYIDHDVQFLVYLTSTVDQLKENRGKWLGLKDAAQRILGVEDWDVGLDKKTSNDLDTVKPYLSKDVKYTMQLFNRLKVELPHDRKITYKLMILAANAYRDMEIHGLPIDLTSVKRVKRELEEEEVQLREALSEYADINFNSSIQLQHLLYVEFGLPVYKTTKKGNPSTDGDTLQKLFNDHPIIEHLIKYKDNQKQLAFLKAWESEAVRRDGYDYLHSSFNLTGTVTGRLSSSDVNLQQIPRDPRLKSLFRSMHAEWELVQLDYSQIELRFAALVAGVSKMKEKYMNGEDLHTEMATIITGKNAMQITKVERTQAKAANFGYLYGMQAESFVEYARTTYGVTLTDEEAHKIRDDYFNAYPELLAYYDEVQYDLLSTGKLTSIMRREYEVSPHILANKFLFSKILKPAINFPIQSAASDYVICSLIDLHANKEVMQDVRLCATIHDSIIIMVRQNKLSERLRQIKYIMENSKLARKIITVPIDIPIEVDIEIGPFGRGVSLEEYERSFKK